MCYDVRYLTKKQIDYAKKYGGSQRDISELEKRLADYENGGRPVYHTNGFEHNDLPVITNQDPDKVQFFSWGLIPFWVKQSHQAVQLSNKTLNAKGESIFEKPSFREAAKKRRCVIIIDGFFEHHHQNGKTYPFHILRKDEQPFLLAGLYDTWKDQESGVIRNTVSIVTTKGNELLAKIHNNPKLSEPRMPLIIPDELMVDWFQDIEDPIDKCNINELIRPFDASVLKAYPVGRLRGKSYVGNKKELLEPVNYPELIDL